MARIEAEPICDGAMLTTGNNLAELDKPSAEALQSRTPLRQDQSNLIATLSRQAARPDGLLFVKETLKNQSVGIY
jgi:hypothetical protein